MAVAYPCLKNMRNKFAEEGSRTHTALRPPDPESGASANSATSAKKPQSYADAATSVKPPFSAARQRLSKLPSQVRRQNVEFLAIFGDGAAGNVDIFLFENFGNRLIAQGFFGPFVGDELCDFVFDGLI